MDALRLSCRCFEIFLYVRLHTHVLTTVACIPCDITVSYLYHIHFAALDELHPALSKRLQPQCSRLRPCIPRVRPDFRSRAHAGLQHRCVSKPYTCIEKLGTVLFVHSEFAMLNLPTVIILCLCRSFPLPFSSGLLLMFLCLWFFVSVSILLINYCCSQARCRTGFILLRGPWSQSETMAAAVTAVIACGRETSSVGICALARSTPFRLHLR